MNIADVMDELGTALDTISGLRVFPYWADRITPPAAVIAWPEPYTYDDTYGRGSDICTIPVIVLVGKVDARTARNLLAEYLSGSGAKSVKQVLEAATYTACDSVVVQSCSVSVTSVAGTEYLSGTFDVSIYGSGA